MGRITSVVPADEHPSRTQGVAVRAAGGETFDQRAHGYLSDSARDEFPQSMARSDTLRPAEVEHVPFLRDRD
ncbi:hypothetical protein GCM10009722_39130 [Williamsia deligens]